MHPIFIALQTGLATYAFLRLVVANKGRYRDAGLVLGLSTIPTVTAILILFSWSNQHGIPRAIPHAVTLYLLAICVPSFGSALIAQDYPLAACGAVPSVVAYLWLALYIQYYGHGGDAGLGDGIAVIICFFIALLAIGSNYLGYIIGRMGASLRDHYKRRRH